MAAALNEIYSIREALGGLRNGVGAIYQVLIDYISVTSSAICSNLRIMEAPKQIVAFNLSVQSEKATD